MATTPKKTTRPARGVTPSKMANDSIKIFDEAKKTTKNILSTISEGSEVSFQALATVSDALIMFRATTHRETLQELVNSGMTENEAEALLLSYRDH